MIQNVSKDISSFPPPALQQRNLLDFVENLKPHKCVEHQCLVTRLIVVITHIVAQKRATSEVKCERNGKLADGLTKDHLAHPYGNETCRFPFRLTIKNGSRRRIGGKGQGGKCIHDQVNPEKLDGIQNRLLLGASHGGNESQDDGGHVHGELELDSIRARLPSGGERERGRSISKHTWRNFLTESLTARPHIIPLTMELCSC